MTNRLEVYFKNENDAESASLKLETLRVSNKFIDAMLNGEEQRNYVPFANANLSSSGTPGMVNPAYVVQAKAESDQRKKENPYDEEIMYMLQFDIVEEDYEEAISILNKFDCYASGDS